MHFQNLALVAGTFKGDYNLAGKLGIWSLFFKRCSSSKRNDKAFEFPLYLLLALLGN